MKALVLCAGFGTRLGELCRHEPKPLLKVGALSIAEHILLRLGAAGVREVFVNLHFGASQLRERLGTGARYGVKLEYFEERELLGTAGTPRALRERCDAAGLLVHYGDVLTDHPLTELFAQHARSAADATIVVHERAGSNSRAVLGTGDRVERFVERPTESEAALADSRWAFSGMCVLSRACLDALPQGTGVDLPRDVFPELAARGRLCAQRHSGFRCAIDSPERLHSAREAWNAGRLATLGQLEVT